MTLEELKAEAKRQGYNLVKARKYVPHARCKCGERGSIWFAANVCKIICPTCLQKTNNHRTERDAWLEWYEMQTGRRFEE